MTRKLEREVSESCNLSKDVEEKGIKKGILISLRNLMESEGWSIERAMAALGIPECEKPQYASRLKI